MNEIETSTAESCFCSSSVVVVKTGLGSSAFRKTFVGSDGDEENECFPESRLPVQARFVTLMTSHDDDLIASLSSSQLLLVLLLQSSELDDVTVCDAFRPFRDVTSNLGGDNEVSVTFLLSVTLSSMLSSVPQPLSNPLLSQFLDFSLKFGTDSVTAA